MKFKNYKIITLFLVLISIVAFTGCKKYLDEKPSKSLVIPGTLKDLQALLDNNYLMNTLPAGAGEASADNYYLTDETWASADEAGRNTYIWGDEIVYTSIINPWHNLYIPVFSSNTVLDVINKIEKTALNEASWNQIKGSALMSRARLFLVLTTTWAKAYDINTSKTDLGIPLRLNSDFTEKSTRASVKDSYDQILSDLLQSVPLLPNLPTHPMRPSKSAAYALVARTYLNMRQYDKAGIYADSCLSLSNNLIDYNELSPTAAYPIAAFNKEVIFNTNGTVLVLGVTRAKIDKSVYESYADNDLRKRIFFLKNPDGSYRFKGSYFGSSNLFTGIATDEIYLIKAECQARSGQTAAAIETLNKLLIKRFVKNNFTLLKANSEQDALSIILAERRKELIMRDLRWADIKRLNKEPGHETTLKRDINNQVYILPPNDNRYALPIPRTVIELSGMQQNPR